MLTFKAACHATNRSSPRSGGHCALIVGTGQTSAFLGTPGIPSVRCLPLRSQPEASQLLDCLGLVGHAPLNRRSSLFVVPVPCLLDRQRSSHPRQPQARRPRRPQLRWQLPRLRRRPPRPGAATLDAEPAASVPRSAARQSARSSAALLGLSCATKVPHLGALGALAQGMYRGT